MTAIGLSVAAATHGVEEFTITYNMTPTFRALRLNGCWPTTWGDRSVTNVLIPRLSRTAVIAAAAILSAAGFLAATSGTADAYSERVRRACKGDYHRLCGQYKPDSPQVRSCMEANAFSISSPCISALVDAGEVDGSRVRKKR
jgi:hypothetical protein